MYDSIRLLFAKSTNTAKCGFHTVETRLHLGNQQQLYGIT